MTERHVLFIRPGSGPGTSRIASDHYADSLARVGGYRVFQLGGEAGAAVEYLGQFPNSAEPGMDRPLRLLRARRQLAESALRKTRCELVHVRNFIGDFLLADMLRTLGAKALVLDIQTLAVARFKHRLFRSSAWLTSRRFDHVFTLNDVIARAYCAGHPSVSRLPVGFDAAVWQPPLLPVARRTGEPLRFVYSGVLHAERHLGQVCEAFAELLAAGAPVELHLFGSGAHGVELQQRWARAGIEFHGHVSSETLVAAMHEMHVGIAWVPMGGRLDANTPLKTLEMLACGLPVIATGTAGNAALIERTSGGLVVDDTPAALRGAVQAALDGALDSADRARLAGAVAEYDWDVLCQRYMIPVFDRLLAR